MERDIPGPETTDDRVTDVTDEVDELVELDEAVPAEAGQLAADEAPRPTDSRREGRRGLPLHMIIGRDGVEDLQRGGVPAPLRRPGGTRLDDILPAAELEELAAEFEPSGHYRRRQHSLYRMTRRRPPQEG